MEKHLLLISLNNIWVVGCSTEKSNSCVSSHLKAAHLCKTLVDRSWISGEKKLEKDVFFFSSVYKIGGRDVRHFSLFDCALLCDARTDLKFYQPGGPLPLTAGLLFALTSSVEDWGDSLEIVKHEECWAGAAASAPRTAPQAHCAPNPSSSHTISYFLTISKETTSNTSRRYQIIWWFSTESHETPQHQY